MLDLNELFILLNKEMSVLCTRVYMFTGVQTDVKGKPGTW